MMKSHHLLLVALLFVAAVASSLLLIAPAAATTKLVYERPPIEELQRSETKKLSSRQFQSALERFHEWFTTNYNDKVNVEVVPVQGARLGVKALKKFRPGEAYLSVPLKMCIDGTSLTTSSSGAGSNNNAPPHFAQYWHWLRNQRHAPTRHIELLLATFLIYSRWVAPPAPHANSTFWSPYIDLLPRQLNTPAHAFTPGDLDLLDGFPKVREKIKVLKARCDHEFHWMRDNVAKHPIWGEKILPLKILNRGRWSWAMSILGTRMIWWEGGPHLVPMLDMVNCDAGPEKLPQGQTQQHVHSTTREGDRAVTRAGWIIQQGDEVLENYGQHNQYYFLNHGFFMDINPHDCIMMNVPPPTREWTKKAMFLTRVPLDNNELCFSLSDPRRMAQAVEIARLYTLPDKTLQTAVAKRALPAKDTDKQTRRVLRFIGKNLKAMQSEMWKTYEKFASREPEPLDAPHKDLIKSWAESYGVPLDDVLKELRRRVSILSDRINVKEAKILREEIERKRKEAAESAKEVSSSSSSSTENNNNNNDNDDVVMQQESSSSSKEKDNLVNAYGHMERKKSGKRTNLKKKILPKIDDDF